MYIGIDLGGTNIAAGIVNKDRRIIASDSRPTLAPRHYSEIVKDMAELCSDLIKKNNISLSDIEGIGIGSPGAIDAKNGIVVRAENLGWDKAPVVEELKKYFKDIPVVIENDANAAAYGEYLEIGNDRGDLIAITLGTGVGGGIIINNNIYHGCNGAAGELGHIILTENGEPCSCGNKGCWEAYASVTALIRQTKKAIEENPDSLMAKDSKVTGRTSFNAAKAGDKAAQAVVDKYIEHVASGIVSIINIFAPEVLVIGGGISKEGDYLLNPIKKYVKEHAFCQDGHCTEIKIAKLRNDAGIVGAAFASVL